VNVWHSLYDTDFNQQIIAGLTSEVLERLLKRKAVAPLSKAHVGPFNSMELMIELDEMVLEAGVKVRLHSVFSSAIVEDGEVSAIIFQDKSGRHAIKAKMFIDASGDADLCVQAGFDTYVPACIQPLTTFANFSGWDFGNVNPFEIIMEHAKEYKITEGFLFGAYVPPNEYIYALNGTRITGRNAVVADDLTYCEIEGRRQVRAMMDILRRHLPGKSPQLNALPSYIGIRETRHIHALYSLQGEDILSGRRFKDAIANGTYPVDIHHQEKGGITLKFLDGRERHFRSSFKDNAVEGRWRAEMPDNPKYYQLPLRSLIPRKSRNVICAGRMIDADKEAFAAARVMVNLNQTGEAAGVAAYLALNSKNGISEVCPEKVRCALKSGGSIIV
jgi:hypothetical protein